MKFNVAHIIILSVGIFTLGCNRKTVADEKPDISATEINNLKQKLSSSKNSFSDIIESFKEINSSLTVSKTIEDFEFRLKYQPHFFLAMKEHDTLPSDKEMTESVIGEASAYEHLHYLNLVIENKKWKTELLKYDVASMGEYAERINYYSFQCQKDIYLIEDKDTLKGAFVNFERTFDISPVINLTIAFERKKKGSFKNLDFVFDDKIFNNGKIKFELNPELVSMFNSPEIKHYNL